MLSPIFSLLGNLADHTSVPQFVPLCCDGPEFYYIFVHTHWALLTCEDKMKSKLRRFIQVTDDYQRKEEIILRDHLAMERTKLANERTLLSYIRASLYLLLGGIGLLGLKDFQDLKIIGYVSLSCSVLLLIIGIFRYTQLKRHLKQVYRPFEEEKS